MFIMLRIDDYATFRRVATPFYYYDIDLFMSTVDKVADLSEKTGIQVHYSVKANSDSRLNDIISYKGLGADCVSGDEIEFAVGCGYDPRKIFFAGVGKSDFGGTHGTGHSKEHLSSLVEKVAVGLRGVNHACRVEVAVVVGDEL